MRQLEIFAHGQRVDVAGATTLEIARSCVMDGVAMSPIIVGCQSHHTDGAPYPVVRRPMTEECAVATVVLNHEQPHEEARCRHGDDCAEPIAHTETFPRQDPEQDKRHGCDQNLEHSANVIRFPVTLENRRPVACLPNTARRLCLLRKHSVHGCLGALTRDRRQHLRFSKIVGGCIGLGRLGKYSSACRRPGLGGRWASSDRSQCRADQRRKGFRAGLSHNSRAMVVDRALADAQISGNVLTGMAGEHQPQNLALAHSQAGNA